ncbi:MAG TPA: VOC family protein [Pseudonocardiaceae bacterium]|jgi:predicted enzyme related to lactoylglutathione lyase
MHLTQIRLIVSDFAAVAAYYRDVIGLTPQFEPVEPPYAAFKPTQGSALCLQDRADLATALGDGVLRESGKADAALVSLRVDDLDAYLTDVTARGADVVAGPVTFGERVRNAYLRDPEGNLIEIQQWLQVRDGGPVPSAG